ncbi:hypothetical protein ABEX25_18885 [Paenibacillus thiaminolyticus]|uniref:hypothetical protein n=1 Tax=Paenibacillus thiaminolyticus TaxID=49283 RepID=UPI003D2D1AE1
MATGNGRRHGDLFFAVSITSLVESCERPSLPPFRKPSRSIGLMLILIGLHKGGVIASDRSSIIAVQSFADPGVLVTFATLALTCILYIRKVPGNLMLAIIGGTALAYLFGAAPTKAPTGVGGSSWSSYGEVFGQFSMQDASVKTLIVAIFSLTLVRKAGALQARY